MKRILVFLVVIAVVVSYTARRYWQHRHEPVPAAAHLGEAQPAEAGGTAFQCDGRVYCSQMTSCAEATFFLRNCPGTKMDGDNNGVPCERQWCR